jgi:hypothetical protein
MWEGVLLPTTLRANMIDCDCDCDRSCNCNCNCNCYPIESVVLYK